LAALKTLESKGSQSALRQIAAGIRRGLEQGGTLAQELQRYPKVFDQVYLGMVEAGEYSGSLDESLSEVAKLIERDLALTRTLRRATAYPLFILLFAAIVVPLLIHFLTGLMGGADGPSGPVPIPVLIGAVVAIYAIWRFAKTPAGHEVFDPIKLRIPVTGSLVKKSSLSRFSYLLGTMIKAGVPLVPAVETAIRSLDNRVLEAGAKQLRDQVAAGEPLGDAMAKNSRVFPASVVSLVAAGEVSGGLGDALLEAARYFDEEVEHTLGLVGTLAGPVIYLIAIAPIVYWIIQTYANVFKIPADLL
jgi:type IV pilus assembly protein PilC